MPQSLEVLIHCPTGQDAKLLAGVLENEQLRTFIAPSISELCKRNQKDAGAIIVADEGLTVEGIEELNRNLSAQEPWSDIPIILLTSGGARNQHFKIKRLESFVESGNVTLLERPFQPKTLMSAIQVALRSRRRQYQVRDLILAHQEATNIRDEFISIASHELKTPLTSLKLQAQITNRQVANDQTIPSDRLQKVLLSSVNQIDRLDKLVEDMLDISRINSKKLSLSKKRFNLSSLLQELIERFSDQFTAVGCTVTTDIVPDVFGTWDAFKIEQVINNLFSNAIRYSPNKPLHITLATTSGSAVLKVIDQGGGIDPKNHERIFERYERASSSISGLGLGLYITRQIMDLHEGKIWVESELGKGSTFIIELPLENSPN